MACQYTTEIYNLISIIKIFQQEKCLIFGSPFLTKPNVATLVECPVRVSWVVYGYCGLCTVSGWALGCTKNAKRDKRRM